MTKKSAFNTLNSLPVESKTLLGLIQKNGPVIKSDLQLMSKMKLTTLNRIMQPLEEAALVVPYGIAESSGGRKPVQYHVNPSEYYVIGIDISRTYTQLIISNLKLDILVKKQFTMDEFFSPDRTVINIYQAIQQELKVLSIDAQRLLGAGLGTVGPVDIDKGTIVNPQNFPASGWYNVPIRDMLEKALGMPVYMDNGANTAVLAEFLFGLGRNYSNIAYLNCGVGIRTGAISSSNIVRAINDAEDAFGHMIIDVDGEPCSCGNYGCIECYSTIPSIMKAFISAVKKGRSTKISKPLDEINYIDLCLAATDHDELSREVITGAASILGSGLANYINLLNPGLIILSGPLINNSDLFYQTTIDVASKKYYLRQDSKIAFSKGGYFGDTAIAAGAAALVIENYIKS